MALQDLPVFDPNSFLDPATGLPLSPADPRYMQAVLPYLDSQLQREAERSANSRGMFYSGSAQADEQQAAGQLAAQVAQQAATQAESEKQLLEQQKFQQQQQLASEQAQMDLARKQGSEAQKAAAIGGGLQGLGTIGGLYGASKLGLIGGGGAAAAEEALPSAADLAAFHAQGGVTNADRYLAAQSAHDASLGVMPAAASPVPGSEYSFPSTYEYEGAPSFRPAVGESADSVLSSGSGSGSGSSASGGAPSSGSGLGGSLANIGAGLAGGMAGNYGGKALYHGRAEDSKNGQMGSEAGGALGGILGSAAGPAGSFAGAGLGSLVGRELAVHPQNVALAPLTLGLSMIPGVNGWLDRNLNPSHWF